MQYSILLKPTGDMTDLVSVYLDFSFGPAYPKSIAFIKLRKEKGLSDAQFSEASSIVKSMVSQLKGQEMIYEIACQIQEYIANNNCVLQMGVKHVSFFDQMELREQELERMQRELSLEEKEKKLAVQQEVILAQERQLNLEIQAQVTRKTEMKLKAKTEKSKKRTASDNFIDFFRPLNSILLESSDLKSISLAQQAGIGHYVLREFQTKTNSETLQIQEIMHIKHDYIEFIYDVFANQINQDLWNINIATEYIVAQPLSQFTKHQSCFSRERIELILKELSDALMAIQSNGMMFSRRVILLTLELSSKSVFFTESCKISLPIAIFEPVLCPWQHPDVGELDTDSDIWNLGILCLELFFTQAIYTSYSNALECLEASNLMDLLFRASFSFGPLGKVAEKDSIKRSP